MDNLPLAVQNVLIQRVLQETSAAWLSIDASGILRDMGGSLSSFGLNNIKKGCDINDQAVFLEGILSIQADIPNIASVKLDNGEYADIYLLKNQLDRWVILLGRTESSRWKGVAQQKANELSLLQQESASSNTINFNNMLGILALEKNKDSSFKLLEPVPQCSGLIYPETIKNFDNLHPDEDFPFLANFIETCQEVWDSSEQKRLKSGPWIEVDQEGKEYALEATALLWLQRKILLIERLNGSYKDQLAVLQHARENALIKQQLEKEVQQRIKIEKSLIEARAIADSANQAKSEFLSSMSHELRTPLNAILGFSELLMVDPNDPLTRIQIEYLNHIINSGQHLLGLIRQILELSKIEAGEMKVFIENIRPKQMIVDSLPILQVLADKKQVLLRYKGKTDAVIRADKTQLKQVIINLLSNAIKYNHNGGTVIIDEVITNKGCFKLLVEDTGIGIPKNKQEELFTFFSRLGQEHSGIEGTGIGLVVTKKIVEAMNGKIGFKSIEGKGSTFWIELPLAEGVSVNPS